MKKYSSWIYLVVVTLLIQPWRNFFCQDDGAYAYSALNWSRGVFQNHSANLSFLFPQISLGALAVEIFSFVDSMRVLNILTWVFFCALVLIFHRLWPKAKDGKVFLLSFFSFPLWWQYGASYLVEIYSCVYAVGFLYSCDRAFGFLGKKNKALWLFGVFIFSFLLGSQIQSLVSLPVFAALFYWLAGSRWIAVLSLAGAALSMGVYYFFPHTPYQEGYGYWIVQTWLGLGEVVIVPRYLFQLVQALFAFGIFFIPFLSRPCLKLFLGVLGAQLFFVLIGTAFSFSVMGGGVLFFDYLPVPLGHFLLSFGIWGLLELYRLIFAIKFGVFEKTLLSFIGVLLAFSAFRFANDIRVVMVPVIAAFYFLVSRKLLDIKGVKSRLGDSILFLVLLMAVSLVTNLYNLNTNQARWNLAREYEAKGVSKNLISAGVGYDLFYLESDCVDGLVKQIQTLKAQRPKSAFLPKEEAYWKSPLFHDWIIAQVNRSYSMGWTPKVEIKPASFFGKPIGRALKKDEGNWKVAKEEVVAYSVLGFSQSLRVVEYAGPRPGTCFDKTL